LTCESWRSRRQHVLNGLNRDPESRRAISSVSNTETKGRSACLVVALIAAVLLLSVYVLSIGPALWLSLHEYIPPELYQIYSSPVFFIAYKWQPLADALFFYLDRFNV